MRLELEFNCEVVERQELLNGTEMIIIAGASAHGWTIDGTIAWNVGLVDFAGEGDLTLTSADGEIYATLVRAVARPDEDDAWRFDLAYEADGGAGLFERVEGEIRAIGTLTGDVLAGCWIAELGGVS